MGSQLSAIGLPFNWKPKTENREPITRHRMG
jgi:hypothetical protein